MSSIWRKLLAVDGNIRAVALDGTELMHALCVQQRLEGLGQLGYSDAVLGGLLIASSHKSNESININAQGSGPFRQCIVDASPEGRVRGFLIEQKDTSMHTFGERGTNGPWGSGILSVLYTNNYSGKIPYTGMVPILTGFLDEAINDYYRDSEQSASTLGFYVDFSGQEIRAARGALVQTLGGASEEELCLVRQLTVQNLRQLARCADEPNTFAHQLSENMGGVQFSILEEQEVSGFCNCSQERIERALILSGETDIVEALGEDPFLSITCDFCRTEYKVSAERVKALFKQDPSRLQ